MKRIFLLLTIFSLAAAFPLRAQDTALIEERVKQLKALVDDLTEDKANQKRQIDALVKEVQSLREQLQSQPKGNYASQEDLRELARKIQEVDEKRKADGEHIAKLIENLGKTPASGRTKPPKASAAEGSTSHASLPAQAIEHTIASGDTLSTIAAAYNKEKGLKLTADLILKVNDGLDPKKLKVGQVILIPLVK
jgi:nucleoid-associated protein YgaU